jgi:6-phosphogluconolactonase (cycloisomerase 2 family)
LDSLTPGNWYIYSVNQSDGSITQLQSYQAEIAGNLNSDPQGRALYVLTGPPGPGACGSFTALGIDPASGVLTNLNTTFSAPCIPDAIAFDPTGKLAYVSSGVGESDTRNGIYGGSIDTTGNLTLISGSPFASGGGVLFGAVEPSQGKFLIEATSGSSTAQLLVYSIDSSTSALSQVSGVEAALPSKYAYVYKMITVAPTP